VRNLWSRPGLTLLELVVTAVVAVLAAGLLLPAARKVRERGDRAGCQDNLRRLGAALHGVRDAYGYFPPAGTGWHDPARTPADWTFPPGADPASRPATRGSHFYFLLPHLGKESLYFGLGSTAGHFLPDYTKPAPRVMLCPADPLPLQESVGGRHLGNYATNVQLFGHSGSPAHARYRLIRKAVGATGGLSATVAYAERFRVGPALDGSAGRAVWMGMQAGTMDATFAWEAVPFSDGPAGHAGLQLPQFDVPVAAADPTLTQAFHPAAQHVGLADGSVRTLGPGVTHQVWQWGVAGINAPKGHPRPADW
jgi:type II secretory pathway pseudopilin PulG